MILDDDINAFVGAVAVARGAFLTIRKTIAYTVAHAFPELAPTFINLVFDVPLMLPAITVLLIDLLTEQRKCFVSVARVLPPFFFLIYTDSPSVPSNRSPRRVSHVRSAGARLDARPAAQPPD